MMSAFQKYANWIHTQFPAGERIKLPKLDQEGRCGVRGVFVVGDLTGRSLLKYALDSGTRAVQRILSDSTPPSHLVIIGAGMAGLAAAIEAQKNHLRYTLLESNDSISTIKNYPKGKPIFMYPEAFTPAGEPQLPAEDFKKEDLVRMLLDAQQKHGIRVTRGKATHLEQKKGQLWVHLEGEEALQASHVIVAIGKSGEKNRLRIPGEDLPHVFNQLYDPTAYRDRQVLVVGGGDSAVEAAIALQKAGARVTISYRKPEFLRVKSENLDELMRRSKNQSNAPIAIKTNTTLQMIRPHEAVLETTQGETETLPSDAVFVLIGQKPPLEFFRKSGIPLKGDWTWKSYTSLTLFLLFCFFLYNWKSDNAVLPLYQIFEERDWFPFNFDLLCQAMGQSIDEAVTQQGHFLQTLAQGLGKPSFYYTLAYSLAVVIFGIRRIRKRKTAYITAQTLTLMAFQIFPLFILPEILLPWAGNNGWFLHGTWGGNVADHLFESYDALGMNRAYWRSYGFILAWPLFIWNVFTHEPMWAWLWISLIQTFVLIPWMIWKWGKGSYCGWICSCGALAETLGDEHRHKMPHGRFWNRFNMLGQIILGVVLILLAFRILGWMFPGSWVERVFWYVLSQVPIIHYSWFVDILLSGILGVGLYFWFSGRMWCRFACPLAALMHIYTRFSRFRIFADKKKCISCNECTETCHQGIDVMHFAQQGLPMNDPECVRCSACVQTCPTGVLSFGELKGSNQEVRLDKLSARTPIRN